MSYDDWLTTPPPMESAPDLPEEDNETMWGEPMWCYVCDRPNDDCGCVENGGNY